MINIDIALAFKIALLDSLLLLFSRLLNKMLQNEKLTDDEIRILQSEPKFQESLHAVETLGIAEQYSPDLLFPVAAVHHYTNNKNKDYINLQRCLRSNNCNAFFTVLAKAMNCALISDELRTYAGTVHRFRQMREAEVDAYRECKRSGDPILYPTFTSTTKSIDVLNKIIGEPYLYEPDSDARKVWLRIKSISGKDIESISYFGRLFKEFETHNEEEVLFKPGTYFEVVLIKQSPNEQSGELICIDLNEL